MFWSFWHRGYYIKKKRKRYKNIKPSSQALPNLENTKPGGVLATVVQLLSVLLC